LVLATACDRSGPELEVRTFKVEHVGVESAAKVIEPYVYTDRPDAPGAISTSINLDTVSVRETADNLARIERVLAEVDVPRTVTGTQAKSFRLHFQLVEANGEPRTDPAIADLAAELAKTFRFQGYALTGEAHVVAREGDSFKHFLKTNSGQYRVQGRLYAHVGQNSELVVYLSRGSLEVLSTSLGVQPGKTLVIGSVPDDQTTLLFVVRVFDT